MSDECSEDKNTEECNESAYDGELFNADPNCHHHVVALWSGVKCTKCTGWFCY